MDTVVWISEPLLRVVRKQLSSASHHPPAQVTFASSLPELVAATRGGTRLALVDRAAIASLAGAPAAVAGPVLAICDEPLRTAIGWLEAHPWISHVVSVAMLEHPFAGEHLDNVTRTLVMPETARLLDWMGPGITGRRIRLTQASSRATRLDKMTDFFAGNGMGVRTVQQLRDAAEELLTNAFYDAPAAAGAFKRPVPRTQDVRLPDDAACDLAYGCREDLALVRVRDPFGSLSRRRLVEVLSRCARTGMTVQVDETMGGAGLGMWRIFSGASFVAVLVSAHRRTEVLVGVTKRAAAGPRPFAFHLFFHEGQKRRLWKLASDDDATVPPINESVTIVSPAK